MRAHHLDLPAEARRDRFLDDSHMFRALNIYLQDRVLDDFFRKHERCRKWVAYIFGCRYPYLGDVASGADGAPRHLTGNMSSGTLQSGTDLGPQQARTQSEDASTMTWVPDMDDEATAQAYAGEQSGLVQMALDAFNNFEIAPDASKLLRPGTRHPVTRGELDALELLLVADACGLSWGEALETESLVWTELELELEPSWLDAAAQQVPSRYIDRPGRKANDGPSIALGTVGEEPKPRRWLYDNVESIHDAQYGMPGDILVDCYLKRYREDACDFWADATARAEQQARQGARLNVMRHENEQYEACMGKGMGPTAKFLVHEGGFNFSPDDITTAKDGTMTTTDEQLRSFARLRGGKRAALQQCLNIFDNFENRVVCGPCRPLVLPSPVTSAMLGKRLKRTDPVMSLPRSLNDVIAADGMDSEMRRTRATLKKYRVLDQALRRANSRAPRALISRIVTLVDAGMKGEDWNKLGLPFRPEEHVPGKDDLARIRPKEAQWLDFLCRPVPGPEAELDDPLDQRGRVFLSRVRGMLDDLSPTSFFNDASPKPLDDFLVELNRACRGPVKLYRFTREEVVRDAPKLGELSILWSAPHSQIPRDAALTVCSTRLDPDGELMIARAQPKIQPEQRIRWREREDEEMFDDDEPEESPMQDNLLPIGADPDSSSDCSSGTADADIPGLPDRNSLRPLTGRIESPEQAAEDRAHTEIFFSCLAYRLGKTLHELEADHDDSGASLADEPLQPRAAGHQAVQPTRQTSSSRPTSSPSPAAGTPHPSDDELIGCQLSGEYSPRASLAGTPPAGACADDAHSQTSEETAGPSRTHSEASSSLSSASLLCVASPRSLGWMSRGSPMRAEALALQVVESGDEWE